MTTSPPSPDPTDHSCQPGQAGSTLGADAPEVGESSEVRSGDDPAWPTACPLCGAQLESAVIDLDAAKDNRPEFEAGEMIALDFCPNPSCPGKDQRSTTREPTS